MDRILPEPKLVLEVAWRRMPLLEKVAPCSCGSPKRVPTTYSLACRDLPLLNICGIRRWVGLAELDASSAEATRLMTGIPIETVVTADTCLAVAGGLGGKQLSM